MPNLPGTAGNPGDLFARALALHREGRCAEAAEIYRLLAGQPGPLAANARINLGAILAGEGRHEEALLHYREVLAERGEEPLALNNMGNSLFRLGRFPEAAACFTRALAQAPDCQQARLGLGASLQRDGDAERAIACFREALLRDPGSAEAHWNLALALLISGRFEEGWREYRWRWEKESFTSPRRLFREPAWDGSPLGGRRILVHAEQGFGDTIQFARYLPLVASLGGTVIAEVQAESLRPLLETMPGVAEVRVMGEPLPPFDLQVPLLSLPQLFGTTLDTVPARVPYLAADPAKVAQWRGRLEIHDGLRVGLVWAGKPQPDPFRSCSPDELAPLGEIPGVNLYSLQVGGAPLTAGPELTDLTPLIADFGDTAALIAHLDLVISVDTAVAHLAGALGKPVWLMLPKGGDYRWLLDREDSPWYPTMTIFRQKRQGDWAPVVERLAGRLDEEGGRLLESAVAAAPFDGWRHYRCGVYLAARARHPEATLRFTKASQFLPGRWEPHYALSASLQLMGRVAEAAGSLEEAIASGGDLPVVHEALGIMRQMLGDLEGAAASYRRAVELDPSLIKARYNLATALKESGRFHEARGGFAEVVRLAPGHADAHWNLAVTALLTGDLETGFRESEWRFRKSERPPVRRWQSHPRWDGSPLEGRTILLWGEQGMGDTLQFVRYAPLVARLGARVVVEVQSASLVSLISRVAGVDTVVVAGEEPPGFDRQASLLDLPVLFGTRLSTVPAEVPYLSVDPGTLERAAAAIPCDGSLRVGVAWCGNPQHANDANRSLPLEKLAALTGLSGVTFYSLQVSEEATRREQESPLALVGLSAAIADFSDTAALASRLDLVITVDTSVAHLCGGLGLPVWVLIPFIPDWRWMAEREDSPWYPTMRLFRQQRPGDWDGVLARVRQALAGLVTPPSPPYSVDHRERGLVLSQQGRFAEAVPELRLALAAHPDDAELLNNLGCALAGGGAHDEAIDCYARAVTLAPSFMAAHYNRGNSLRSLGRGAEAEESYRRALALEPGLAQGWHNLALALQDQGKWDEAKEAYQAALSTRPEYLEARHNLGELYHGRGELDAAEACFRQVLSLDPRYLPSWNALGIALQVRYRLEEAVECYQTALALDPDYLHALNNLGSAWKALDQPERSVECYRRVLEIDPGYADAHWNLALVQLLLGEYREGWRGYEWRFEKVDPIPRREYPRPRWDGSPLDGKVILLHCEQGFGDTVQFIRYAALVARRGGEVVVECQSAAIKAVVATVPGVSRVVARGEELPPFDVHAPVMSLPYLCGTTLSTVPASVPYVAADPQLVERWRERLSADGLRVGLVWAGRKSYKDDGKRSLALERFAPLAGVTGARFYSLQVGEGAEQAASPPAGLEVVDLGCSIRDFADTAAIMAGLDLVIAVDTAVAHLAGALAKPVWVLLPTGNDWRWLMEREDSPWYPTARLFRQRRRGDWDEVLARVAAELRRLTAGPTARSPWTS
ncbi:hypothetical protein GMSM_02540 [Geomonas sp. Red276]